MFFILSKLFAVFIKPLNILLILGLYAWFGRNEARRRRALRWCIGGLILFGNPMLIGTLGGAWETGRKSPDELTRVYDVGILLGGYTLTGSDIPQGMLALSRSDRLTAAIQLYQTGKIKRLLLSGGSSAIFGKEEPEAEKVRRYLVQIGIPDSALILEPRSRNTRENALFSKHLIDSLAPGAHCLLITSAWHLPRAARCFNKAGLPCETFGVDFAAEKWDANPLKWIEPDVKAFWKWEYLIKEWIGFAVYKAKGYL